MTGFEAMCKEVDIPILIDKKAKYVGNTKYIGITYDALLIVNHCIYKRYSMTNDEIKAELKKFKERKQKV